MQALEVQPKHLAFPGICVRATAASPTIWGALWMLRGRSSWQASCQAEGPCFAWQSRGRAPGPQQATPRPR